MEGISAFYLLLIGWAHNLAYYKCDNWEWLTRTKAERRNITSLSYFIQSTTTIGTMMRKMTNEWMNINGIGFGVGKETVDYTVRKVGQDSINWPFLIWFNSLYGSSLQSSTPRFVASSHCCIDSWLSVHIEIPYLKTPSCIWVTEFWLEFWHKLRPYLPLSAPISLQRPPIIGEKSFR